jgi:hypothetical protein
MFTKEEAAENEELMAHSERQPPSPPQPLSPPPGPESDGSDSERLSGDDQELLGDESGSDSDYSDDSAPPSPPPPPAGDSGLLTPGLLDIVNSSESPPPPPAGAHQEDAGAFMDSVGYPDGQESQPTGSANGATVDNDSLDAYFDAYNPAGRRALVNAVVKWEEKKDGKVPDIPAVITLDIERESEYLTLTECKYLLFRLVKAKATQLPLPNKKTGLVKDDFKKLLGGPGENPSWTWRKNYWEKCEPALVNMQPASSNERCRMKNEICVDPRKLFLYEPGGKISEDVKTALNTIRIAWFSYCLDGGYYNFGEAWTMGRSQFTKYLRDKGNGDYANLYFPKPQR